MSAGSDITNQSNLKWEPGSHSAAMTRPDAIISRKREYSTTNYDAETLCSLSTLVLTVGRFIMRSCHAV